MNGRHIFEIWAPPKAVWSPWVKPVLFAALDTVAQESPPIPTLSRTEASWLTPFNRHAALVLDLPGVESMRLGLQLSEYGYRPVPLFNTVHGHNSVVPMLEVVQGLRRGVDVLNEVLLPDGAPPVFLLDSNRRKDRGPALPGQFDNRWMVFPQDFPSAAKLREHDVQAVVLVQEHQLHPREDLAHVLRRWQDAGLAVYGKSLTGTTPESITVKAPGRYRWLLFRLFALAGLMRNSAGGFGSVVPDPSTGRGGFG